MKILIISSCLLVLLLGCATAPHRARQYSAEYDALNEETQKRSAHGYIRDGDSPESVYVAMGPPQSRKKIMGRSGIMEDHWIYLGRPAEGSDVLEPGNYKFVTVNDFSWGNPFAEDANKQIHVVFIGNSVLRVDIEEDNGEKLNKFKQEFALPKTN